MPHLFACLALVTTLPPLPFVGSGVGGFWTGLWGPCGQSRPTLVRAARAERGGDCTPYLAFYVGPWKGPGRSSVHGARCRSLHRLSCHSPRPPCSLGTRHVSPPPTRLRKHPSMPGEPAIGPLLCHPGCPCISPARLPLVLMTLHPCLEEAPAAWKRCTAAGWAGTGAALEALPGGMPHRARVCDATAQRGVPPGLPAAAAVSI